MTEGRGGWWLRLLREPLLHFLLLGAGLFAIYAVVGDEDRNQSPDLVLVDEPRVLSLARSFERTWQRPPSSQELDGLVEGFVKEEILYREALALGLDLGDTVIRRRMSQKMQFMNADINEARTPTEAELQDYLDANPDRFRRPSRFSFEQIYLNPDRSGGDPQARAAALLDRLKDRDDGDPRELSDPTMLPIEIDRASEREISAVFGQEFARAVAVAPLGRWSGPYRSSFGLHLLRVRQAEVGRTPILDEVRAGVEREWSNTARKEAEQRFYQQLRQRYRVEIRLPDQQPSRSAATTTTP